eukprot:gnl/TRDRNA2_/TRDRNA2_114979_c1_seq1.p1 gnl/TRDRNA2_/TRDRNA2_114979_c1~~gnl/TRDRNA2_/TRDRNA2_114979_c1_seq1.p1  ORF type:complete len:311 (-),score=46.42 gnl/TRDRNA2_/TRDRNA2_114979_c1_seq1:101-1033(-)
MRKSLAVFMRPLIVLLFPSLRAYSLHMNYEGAQERPPSAEAVIGASFLTPPKVHTSSARSHLAQESLAAYRRDGYVLVPGIFSDDEIEELTAGVDEVIKGGDEVCWAGSWEDGRNLRKGRVLGIHGPQEKDSSFLRLLANRRLGAAFADVIGSDAVAFHHAKVHVKPARDGASFPMHQDRPYFPFRNDSMVAAFIHLEDTNKHNGGLSIVPGSHRLGQLPDQHGAVGHYVSQKQFPIEKGTEIQAKRGDVAFFSYLTVHGSYPNLADSKRRMILVQAFDPKDQMITAAHMENGRCTLMYGSHLGPCMKSR